MPKLHTPLSVSPKPASTLCCASCRDLSSENTLEGVNPLLSIIEAGNELNGRAPWETATVRGAIVILNVAKNLAQGCIATRDDKQFTGPRTVARDVQPSGWKGSRTGLLVASRPGELQSPDAKGTGPRFRPSVSWQNAFSRRKMDQSPDFAVLLASRRRESAGPPAAIRPVLSVPSTGRIASPTNSSLMAVFLREYRRCFASHSTEVLQ